MACEEALKDRLRSPSSYKRIEITRDDKILTRDEFLVELQATKGGQATLPLRLQSFDEGRIKPTLLRAYMEYDAPNAFGVMIRGLSVCEKLTDDGSEANIIPQLVRIDGKTHTRWLLEQVR